MAFYWLFGAALVLAGLTDVFLTVLHYDTSGLVAARSYRIIWLGARGSTRMLGRKPRGLLQSMAAPFMVATTIGGWLAVQVVGFALLYMPGVDSGHHFALGQLKATFWTALYFSAATLTSLSFSDVEPRGVGYHGLAALETIIGLGILTLAISYLLGLYRVLQDQSVLAARLQHQSCGSNDPHTLLRPHFHEGQPVGLSTFLRDLHHNLSSHYEGMLRYPIVYYFHTRRPNRSIPYIFWFVGASGAALRWGLPQGHPAAEDPWLPALLEGYREMVHDATERFLPGTPEEPPPPVGLEEFRLGYLTRTSGNERLSKFLEVDTFMHEIACLQLQTDCNRAYDRYVEWCRFTSRGRVFVQAASRDLGLDPNELYSDPGKELF